jgi:hypothetical protein
VIGNWSYGPKRNTSAILLDMNPDLRMAVNVRHATEHLGDKVVDLHVRRVGSGHMRAVESVATSESKRDSRFYHAALQHVRADTESDYSYNRVAGHQPRNAPLVEVCAEMRQVASP